MRAIAARNLPNNAGRLAHTRITRIKMKETPTAPLGRTVKRKHGKNQGTGSTKGLGLSKRTAISNPATHDLYTI